MKIKSKKSLGQHFLLDTNICDAIVSSCIDISDKTVLEIGPGHGSLTTSILKKNPKHLFLIEKDYKLAKILTHNFETAQNVTVIEGDALKIDFRTLTDEQIIIISNLPYNIGTQLLCDWLCFARDKIKHMTLMFQMEVADRVVAHCGAKNYGRLSILCQFLANVEKSFDVDKSAFLPPPKVTSSILQVSPLQTKITSQELETFERIIKKMFLSRRKMIKASLEGILSDQDYVTLNIDKTQRAQDLKIEDFWKICLLSLNEKII